MSKAPIWPALLLALAGFAALGFFIACSGSGGGDDDEDEEEPELEAPGLEELLEDATGYPWSLSEGDIGAFHPAGWTFLFAFKPSLEQSLDLDEAWAIDFDEIGDLLVSRGSNLRKEGLDLSQVRHQIVLAKVESFQDRSRARFATKLELAEGVMRVDPLARELLGDSVGGLGGGWYAVYHAARPQGFLVGDVEPCPGAATDVLVTATDSSFYARPGATGAFALPSAMEDEGHPRGKPAMAFFHDGTCFGLTSYVLTDTTRQSNPKCLEEAVPEDCPTPQNMIFDDGSVVGAWRSVVMADGITLPAPEEGCENCDFESGNTENWDFLSLGGTGSACFGVSSQGHGELFPDSGEDYYGYLTTGGDKLRTCVAYRSLLVPDDARELVIRYDLASQEYPEWLGSPYTDLFSILIAGSFRSILSGAVSDGPEGEDFGDMPDEAAVIAGIDSSADALFNESGAVFDGHLGGQATWPVFPGEDITLVLVVTDTADTAWDTALLIDSLTFR